MHLLDHRTKVPVCRRDQSDIDLVAMSRAYRLHLMRFDRAQQLGLQVQWQLSNLVREQGAAVSRAKVAKRSSRASVKAPRIWPKSCDSASDRPGWSS